MATTTKPPPRSDNLFRQLARSLTTGRYFGVYWSGGKARVGVASQAAWTAKIRRPAGRGEAIIGSYPSERVRTAVVGLLPYSCTTIAGCAYLALCRAICRPLNRILPPPQQYKSRLYERDKVVHQQQ